jgi:hypothetical protein
LTGAPAAKRAQLGPARRAGPLFMASADQKLVRSVKPQ